VKGRERAMTRSVRVFIETFEHLPESDRLEAAFQILRRTAQLDFPPLDDETLTLTAEELFLELDARETDDAHR
jgi:hypothetical protein